MEEKQLTKSKIQWSDDQLEKKSVDFLQINGYTSPGNSAGPHTILTGLKKNNDNVILGISRIKDLLHNLNQGGVLKSTQNKKYYLIIEKIKL